ncbi:MAG: hypothetical protein U0529_13845 [Thermoanaerobaculia bacterium]
MAEPDITVDKDAEENGLGNMVAELLRANVATSSYKGRVFSRMKGSVGLDATDAEVKVTLVFDRGRCVVHDGLLEGTAVTVSADSDSIIELSNVRLVGGLPFYFDRAGRAVVAKALRGVIRIRGLLRHPVTLTRLGIVLSVN